MSLDRAIQSGKEHRRQYWDSRRIDPSCRNHRGCGFCEGNRRVQQLRLSAEAHYDYRDFNEIVYPRGAGRNAPESGGRECH